MILSDRDILTRLISFDSLGLGISLGDALKLVKEKRIPEGLRQALEGGKIIIEPFPDKAELEERLGPASLDLGIGEIIWLPGTSEKRYEKIPVGETGITIIDPRVIDFSRIEEDFGEDQKVDLSTEEFVLRPGEFIITTTQEILMLPIDVAGRIIGRSRFARHGLSISVEAPKIDPGFIGKVALEIHHRGRLGGQPIRLSPRLLICQIIFETLSSPSQRPYFERGGRFLGQEAP